MNVGSDCELRPLEALGAVEFEEQAWWWPSDAKTAVGKEYQTD